MTFYASIIICTNKDLSNITADFLADAPVAKKCKGLGLRATSHSHCRSYFIPLHIKHIECSQVLAQCFLIPIHTLTYVTLMAHTTPGWFSDSHETTLEVLMSQLEVKYSRLSISCVELSSRSKGRLIDSSI